MNVGLQPSLQVLVLTSSVKTETTTTLTPSASIYHAQVTGWGECPKYIQVKGPEYPSPLSDQIQVRVSAAASHKLVQLRSSGKHYSARTLPHVPGVDGVGVTTEGKEVYFFNYGEGLGSFAEVVNIPKRDVFALPASADKLQVAALLNPAMSSFMALRTRTQTLPHHFSVLILGATSMSGMLAVPIARALGAGKIIGCARNQDTLDTLGLDQTIRLSESVVETDFASLGHIDVILDYLYGPPAAHLLASLKSSGLTQYIQIGDLAGREIPLHSKVIRSRNLIMTGSGVGSWRIDQLREELPALLETMGSLPHHKLNVIPLSQIEKAWKKESIDRTIFVP